MMSNLRRGLKSVLCIRICIWFAVWPGSASLCPALLFAKKSKTQHREDVKVWKPIGGRWQSSLELKVAPAWRAPKSRGKNRSKCVPWLQRWRLQLPPRKPEPAPNRNQSTQGKPKGKPNSQTQTVMMFHLFHMKTHVTKIMIIITFFLWRMPLLRWTLNAGQRIPHKVAQHGPWTQDWRLVFLPSGHCSIFMKSLHINQCSSICRRAEKGIKDLWPWPAQAESSFKYCLT